ncbi:kinase-like protein [Ophiobolus disseminans]|uniref:Kinase-like protein n=1 Tax=Ophiobolus disseminans TaxID=1469910 RepID=A0A6A6ZZE2_9PLEO|nr:kinase-like protein [Ophiobolus disseminans]
MVSLRDSLRKQRVLNYERHFFVPEGSLEPLITAQAVRDSLTACNISAWNVDTIQTTILSGARKTFAILVLINQESNILRFIEHDDFQDQPLDSKLPIPLDSLMRIIPHAAEEFFEEQRRLTVPIFTQQLIHRYFSDETILPFISVRALGQGGFGQVHEVTLPWTHQRYVKKPGNNLKGLRLAKKELHEQQGTTGQPSEFWLATGASEHKVLSILHHLKHPSILELLASYTHQGKHSLIFPLATGGDLHDFLIDIHRPEPFVQDNAVYTAMAGLGSALATLHEYRSTTFDMELMGYHHDLKPRNILVSGSRFILSDFGLSKLEARDESKTDFKVGKGHYLAPECEDLLNQFKKGVITRASDVWSLGCVMLEVIIFMRYGSEGVHQFRDERRYQVGNFVTRTFFVGADLNPVVISWTKKLSAEDIETRRFADLVLKMLRIVPENRPKAQVVTIGLRSIAVQSLYRPAHSDLGRFFALHKTYDIRLEVERFEAWGSTLGFHIVTSDSTDGGEDEIFHNNTVFEMVTAALDKMREVVSRYIATAVLETPVHLELRAVNDTLISQLRRSQQERLYRLLESQFMSASGDMDLNVPTPWLPFVDSGLVYATIQMHALMKNDAATPQSNMRIAREALGDWKPFQAAFQAMYHVGAGQRAIPVLIEYIVYEAHWTDDIGKKLFNRIGALVNLLSSPTNATRLRTLACRGYFHAPDVRSFGIVYELPVPSAQPLNEPLDIFSLRDLVQRTQDIRQRPDLGELFRFAHSLAISTFSFHNAGWLHKALSPSNIIFVLTDRDRKSFDLSQKYRIIGFNHSRPDNPTEYTEAAWKRSAESRLYQHPHYLEQGSRFCVDFDYYSFGLVLLELGMWKPLLSMVARPESEEGNAPQVKASADLTKYLLERRVPLLGPRMGKRYRDVVSFCLKMDLGGSVVTQQDEGSRHDSTQKETRMDFERNVIQELSHCDL